MSEYNRNQAQQRADAIRERLRQQNLARLNANTPPEGETPPDPRLRRVEVQVQPDSVIKAAPEVSEVEAAEVEQAEPQVDYAEELKRAQDRWKAADALLKNQGADFRRTKQELEAAKRAAEEQANALRAELEELRVARERERPVSSEDLRRYFTADQIERLGEDECRNIVAAQRAIAEDITKVNRNSVQREIKEALAGVEQERKTLQELRHTQFLSTVDTLVPDWRQIDNDPEFIAWLEEVDELRGTTRRQMGEEASHALDAKRFAAVYNSFKTSRAKPTTVASPKRVLPNGVPPVSAPTAQQKVAPMTPQEVLEYRNKQARGYYKRNPKELARDQERFHMTLRRA